MHMYEIKHIYTYQTFNSVYDKLSYFKVPITVVRVFRYNHLTEFESRRTFYRASETIEPVYLYFIAFVGLIWTGERVIWVGQRISTWPARKGNAY